MSEPTFNNLNDRQKAAVKAIWPHLAGFTYREASVLLDHVEQLIQRNSTVQNEVVWTIPQPVRLGSLNSLPDCSDTLLHSSDLQVQPEQKTP